MLITRYGLENDAPWRITRHERWRTWKKNRNGTCNEVSFRQNNTASEDFKSMSFRRDSLPDIVYDVGQRNAALVLIADLGSAATEMVHVVVDEGNGVVLA